MATVKLLSRDDVKQLLTMEGAIGILEDAFAGLARGEVVMPVRTPIKAPEHEGLALFMPAYVPSLGALGAKVVTVYKNNPSQHNLPNVMGTIILLNPETGAPVCIMDGGYLTAVRTGAVSGLATKHLARRDAKVHALFGTGVQAKTQAWAVAAARPLAKCLVFSVDDDAKKQAFAAEVQQLTGVPTEVAADAEAAVRAADILTLATSAKDPIISGAWVEPGMHINGIGSHAPGMRELDTATVVKSRVFPDSLEACKAEAGDFQIPAEEGMWSWDAVAAELGEVVAGMKPGREADTDITLFKSVGLALQDLATASFVHRQALERGAGSEFEF